MAKLTMFMLCDQIKNNTSEADVSELVAPQVVLRPQFIPGALSFGIGIGVRDVDLKKESKISFTISDPDGVVIQDSGSNTFPAINYTDTIPAEYQGLLLNMDIRNMVIQSEGVYMLALYINGEVAGTHEIPIFKKAEP